MTIPQWALLGFSAGTPGLLMATVGVPLVQHQGAAASTRPVLYRHGNLSSRNQWTNKNKFVALES